MDRYRLAPVRDLRERDERVKRGDLADAVGATRTTQADVDRAAARVSELRERIAKAAEGRTGETVHQLALADRFLSRLRADLDGAIGAHLRAQAAHAGKLAELDEARGRLAISRAEREVIERHFTSWRQAKQRAAERRED